VDLTLWYFIVVRRFLQLSTIDPAVPASMSAGIQLPGRGTKPKTAVALERPAMPHPHLLLFQISTL
jgi:hypothetical protein